MKKILFFDDDEFITKLLIQNLKTNHGWTKDNDKEIIFISKVEDLMDEIINRNKKYDLFVLDIMVPVPSPDNDHFSENDILSMNNGLNTGMTITRKIRNMEQYKEVPIIYLSSRRINDAEGIIYLRKPVSARVLSDRMSELLNH